MLLQGEIMENKNVGKKFKKEVHYRGAGGMYSGVDVPVKLLDVIIFGGIAVIAVLIFM